MPRPAVFSTPTTLYHPIEGEYTFPAGSPDPGAAWTEKPGGEPAGAATAEQALKDLIAAQEQVEELQRRLASAEHDKSNLARERDEANARAKDAEARAEQAESAKATAEAARDEAVLERDAARSDLMKLQQRLAAFDADGDGKPGGSRKKSPAKTQGEDDGGL